jgi:hypothetical protein
MSATAAPVLGIAGITVFRDVVIGDKALTDMFKVIAAAGIGVVAFAGLEKINRQAAIGIAYLALMTAVVVPMGGRPSFAEALTGWWSSKGPGR